MDSFLTVAQQVAILFVLIGAGAMMRRAKFFEGGAIEGLIDMLVMVVTPCLIVDVFQRPFDPAKLKGIGIAFAVCVLGHLLVIASAFLLVRHREENVRVPLMLSAVFSNAGFMGIPLEQAILGDEGVFFGIVYVVVFNLFIWSWGYAMMRGNAGGAAGGTRLRSFVNPGTIGIALGLPFFFLSAKLPEVIGVPVRQIAGMNTPLAMVVVGYCLAGAKLGRLARLRAVYVAAFIRLVGYPLAVIAALYPFRHQLDRNLMLATVVAASAPVAAMVSMFAAKFDRDVDVAVGMVSGTTLLSILTMPAVIALAMSLLG
ncbi:MAG: AEC family transporter [Kiritimatiellia bacterium]